MSTTTRKLGYYNLIFKKHGKDEYYFDKKHFMNFLIYLDNNNIMLDIKQKNKAFKLNFYRYQQLNYLDIVDLTFKSCKYNHSPEYMSKLNGSERPSDKKLDEGEKELTHSSLKITDVEVEVVFEERRSGISISEFTKYLNTHYKSYNKSLSLPNNHTIICGIVTHQNFLEGLNSMEEIKLGEVYTDTKILGSEMLDLINREDRTLSNEVVVKFKSEPQQSISKRIIQKIFKSIGTTDSKVSRLRIYGKDDNNNGIRIDSQLLKQTDYVTVDLYSDGTINSQSIFEKMKSTLGVDTSYEQEV